MYVKTITTWKVSKAFNIEIELSVLSRQCLERRIPNLEILSSEIAAWETERNQKKPVFIGVLKPRMHVKKMQSLYPNI
ncbi:hypothetical protein NIES23_62560 (plasmid) [Trichormus variabilis NIES-23]|uniref:Transposase n=1 Tax=Trichormus variabilis NIES-23 TaxID=1973479 RepID=A0A1Z4KWY2_ANAVA|nr:hypothetical protein NIES23_62560 [Trichormus variabilis NIES-23]